MLKKSVYFIRHAKPDYSVIDDFHRPLLPEGIEGAKKATEVLVDIFKGWKPLQHFKKN